MEKFLRLIKKFIPKRIYKFFQPTYHWFLAYAAAFAYGFPSKKLKIIGITGTNGKSTVVAMLSAILEEVGESTASISSLRFKIKNHEWKNTLKMTMPGRFKLQKFLYDAVLVGCRYAVIEVTSEGIKQFRHKGINFFMAILTNVTPEHIESHGSFEKYREAKAKLFYGAKVHILNNEDQNIDFFKKIPLNYVRGEPTQKRIIYSKDDLPKDLNLKLLGEFNKENAAAAWATAKELGISEEKIKLALEKIEFIPGRLEFIQHEPFSVIVDYAHTPDALKKVYETLKGITSPPNPLSLVRRGGEKRDDNLSFGGEVERTMNHRLICVLGAAGGGRDKWKRPEMGKIAKEFCSEIILTNEDPYDELPGKILEDIGDGRKILDRREAIREALKSAKPGDTVIITGKGAEPWIMGPNGSKIPWDDRGVAWEELKKL